jgi:chemotaxis protein MotB
MVPLPNARASQTGKPGTTQPIPSSSKPDAAAAPTGNTAAAVAAPANPVAPSPAAAATQDGAAPVAAGQSAAAATAAKSADIAKDIKASVASMMSDKASPGLAVAATKEGVTISLTDDANYAMFPVGSAVPAPKTVVLLERIAKVLAQKPGEIVIRGHTDGRPFHSADYDNWRLSAARAQMAYYALLRGGLDQKRVVAIEGHADRALKNPRDPYAAENRRIEILVRDAP